MNASADEEEPGSKEAGERMSGGIHRHVTIIDNRVDSKDLFLGTRDVVIRHGRDAYHLRLTAQNKLILTK
jgi:hemin uptake protein HemP